MTNPHVVKFPSYYAQCFYLITLFLHDPSHDFLDKKRQIKAYEGSPKGEGPGQRKSIIRHGIKGGAKMVGGGRAEKEWEQVQGVMGPIYQRWIQEGAPGATGNFGPHFSRALQLIVMLKAQPQLARAAVVPPSIQQILQNYLLTYDTIASLQGSFFIEDQLFQRIGTHTQENLSCQLGNTCLVNIDSISAVLKNVPQGTFVPYNGIVASNGNFFLPMENSIQVQHAKDKVGNAAVLIRIDLAVQNVPMVTDAIQKHLEMVKVQMAQQGMTPQQIHQHLQVLSAQLMQAVGYWNIIISNNGTTVTQGREKKGGQPVQIPQPHVLRSQSANQWFQMQFGFAMNCGVQALLSTWLRVGIALAQIQKAASFTRDTAAAAGAPGPTVASRTHQIANEGLANLRASTNYYTKCVVNDECDGEENMDLYDQGGGGMMSGGMSARTETAVKIAYSWYMAVALNSVYFPLQKTIPEGNPKTVEDQIEVQKLLMNESMKIILPLVTMGQTGKGKKIGKGKGGIDKKLLEKFKQIVCNCEKGSCEYGGVLLEARRPKDSPSACRLEVPRRSEPVETKLILGASGQRFPFLHLLGQKNCNKAPCGPAVVPGWEPLGQRVSNYFTTKAQQNKKFLINNALSTNATYISKAIKFCPESSIFDSMSMCSSGTIQSDGIEIGNMDVTIHHQNVATYQIQVEVIDSNHSVNIKSGDWDFANVSFNIIANLRLGNEALLNNLTINIPASDSWGKGGIFGAANVLMELGQIVDELNNKIAEGKKNLRTLYNFIGTDGVRQREARSAIVGVLFKKGLGDNLQELNGVITNGGYVTGSRKTTTGRTPSGEVWEIIPPDDGRMMLGTDQPSAVRAMFLLMMGEGSINKNAVAGYVGADGHYILAARKTFQSQQQNKKRDEPPSTRLPWNPPHLSSGVAYRADDEDMTVADHLRGTDPGLAPRIENPFIVNLAPTNSPRMQKGEREHRLGVKKSARPAQHGVRDRSVRRVREQRRAERVSRRRRGVHGGRRWRRGRNRKKNAPQKEKKKAQKNATTKKDTYS